MKRLIGISIKSIRRTGDLSPACHHWTQQQMSGQLIPLSSFSLLFSKVAACFLLQFYGGANVLFIHFMVLYFMHIWSWETGFENGICLSHFNPKHICLKLSSEPPGFPTLWQREKRTKSPKGKCNALLGQLRGKLFSKEVTIFYCMICVLSRSA